MLLRTAKAFQLLDTKPEFSYRNCSLFSLFPFPWSPYLLSSWYRLGHREQKDEWLPRRVDVFTRHNVLPPNAVISAGSVNSSCTAGRLYCSFIGL